LKEKRAESVALTDQNMAALFAAFYGIDEGPRRMADVGQYGAEKALEMARKREQTTADNRSKKK